MQKTCQLENVGDLRSWQGYWQNTDKTTPEDKDEIVANTTIEEHPAKSADLSERKTVVAGKSSDLDDSQFIPLGDRRID